MPSSLPQHDPSTPRAARFLEQTLLANIVVHAAAIATMGLILMKTLPGGPVKDDALRIAAIAEHPWLWRIGWLPWHLCALMNLLLSASLVTTRWMPRVPAVLSLLLTIAAVIPEQIGEIGWVSRGVALAVAAHRSGDLGPYLQFEAWAFHLAVIVGSCIYMLMAFAWTWCFIAAGTWNRALSWATPLAWGFLSIGSFGLLLPEAMRPGDALVGLANGAGFALLEVWLILVAEAVLRRSRPDEAHGRMAPWRHPWPGVIGRTVDVVASSRFLRALCEWLPVPGFRSDIRDVIYCNYVVPAEKLLPLVPEGLQLQRLGPDGRFALFTHLTYEHGHFGPAFFGPLRRWLPSPVHTNWRIYVRDPQSGLTGIYFVTNAIASTPHALAARLLSEGMPMHALAHGSVRIDDDGSPVPLSAHPSLRANENEQAAQANAGDARALARRVGVHVRIEPGKGSGPDLDAQLLPGPAELPEPFNLCWQSYRAFLEYAVPQDRAFSVQPWYRRLTRQEIQLGIPLDLCEPLIGTVRSRAAQELLGEANCVCFRVPRVTFVFTREEHDQQRSHHGAEQ